MVHFSEKNFLKKKEIIDSCSYVCTKVSEAVVAKLRRSMHILVFNVAASSQFTKSTSIKPAANMIAQVRKMTQTRENDE